ncbi:MAG: hypothetical protein KZQ75_05165 [Candidatus Thiodiazotropha sp. (ex Myrtea spinifera)]|nr:hypothetical protein [Candidatus Thiodiazotropha sp. (ex Myrtea spinifera)]
MTSFASPEIVKCPLCSAVVKRLRFASINLSGGLFPTSYQDIARGEVVCPACKNDVSANGLTLIAVLDKKWKCGVWSGIPSFIPRSEYKNPSAGIGKEEALRAYAQMMNTLDIGYFEPILALDIRYTSQYVLEEIESKQVFLKYMTTKLNAASKSNADIFAEMGTVRGYSGQDESCVVLAQYEKSNLIGVVFAEVEAGKVKRLDLCAVPSPNEAIRLGDYPN